MEMCGSITANSILVWVVMGLCLSFGWNLIAWPFRRYA